MVRREIARCNREQRAAMRYLRDHGFTGPPGNSNIDGGTAGAWMGLCDWTMEEIIIRGELRRVSSSENAIPGRKRIRVRRSSCLSWLNGDVIYDFAANNDYPTCAFNGIGCLDQYKRTIDLTPEMFDYGVENSNIFTFVVAQRGGGGFGLNYAGSVDGFATPNEVPEPSTYMLIGAGLIGLYLARKS